jgi:hypothetical protein
VERGGKKKRKERAFPLSPGGRVWPVPFFPSPFPPLSPSKPPFFPLFFLLYSPILLPNSAVELLLRNACISSDPEGEFGLCLGLWRRLREEGDKSGGAEGKWNDPK